MRKVDPAPEGPPSYDELHVTHRGHVLRLCRLLLSDFHEAEEVAQEVFVKMYRQYRTLGPTEAFPWRPWLTRVAVNACRDLRRSKWWRWWRVSKGEFSEEGHASPVRTPEQDLLDRETREQIWRAFRRLSARQQEVFALRHVEGWATEEVAAFLGMTTGSVKVHLFRAIRRLRQALEGV